MRIYITYVAWVNFNRRSNRPRVICQAVLLILFEKVMLSVFRRCAVVYCLAYCIRPSRPTDLLWYSLRRCSEDTQGIADQTPFDTRRTCIPDSNTSVI